MAAKRTVWLGVLMFIAAGLADLSIVLLWLSWTESSDLIVTVAKTAQFLGFSTMFMGLGMALMKPTIASDGLRQVLQTNKTLLMIVMSGLGLVVLAILFRFFYQFSGLL